MLGSLPAAAAVVAAVLLAGLPSLAQQESPPRPASQPSDSKVEEIVVKGSSQGSEDFASPDSVTSFNAADLQALGAQTIEDIAAFTPNLEIVSSGSTTPTFFIRGVGLNDFNANATSSVAIYQDDVNLNAQGLQLPTIFDVESVSVLRGPQGTGLARNASAGAIKIYTHKPSGQYNGFLIGSAGNYSLRDYQGAVEAPVIQDILSARVAFRWSDRDGFVKNACGGLVADPTARPQRPYGDPQTGVGIPVATCRATRIETFPERLFGGSFITNVPAGLPTEAGDLHNWGVRGTLRFEPGLDTSWLAGVQYSRRHELSRLGQAYGRAGLDFGTADVLSYQKPSIAQMQARRFLELAAHCNCDIEHDRFMQNKLRTIAIRQVAPELARNLDDDPYTGYYDKVGPTQNEILSTYLRGEIYLPLGIEMTTISGYAEYDRLIDLDIDFSPTVLAEANVPDDLYQLSEEAKFEGDLGSFDPATWGFGGYFLYEHLHVVQDITLNQNVAALLTSGRDYSQRIRSYGVYGEFARDIWNDWTIDGGVRWNSESKNLRMKILTGFNNGSCFNAADELVRCRDLRELSAKYFQPEETWQAPTGTLRLAYRFSEDTRLYWKYTRGWKAGHYNAVAPPRKNGISVAPPEQIDAFETGLDGTWFHNALTWNAALFYYTYDDYQLFTIEADYGTLPAFVVLSVDNAEVYGGELDAVARPWQGAFFEVRGSWLESRFVDFVSQQAVRKKVGGTSVTLIREIDSTGNRLLNSPQFKVSFTLEQAIPLGKYGALIPRYDGVWTSESFFDATEGRGIPNPDGTFLVPRHTFAQQAFWIHNARLSYAPPSQNPVISLWVRNIENKPYRTLGADAITFLGTTLHFVGDPRTYGADVVVTF
jgi:outer membrane receptor protein involved in Fe transport